MAQRERALQTKILRALNAIPGVVARNNSVGPAHIAGDPDIYGCAFGRAFAFEVKLPGEYPRPNQVARLKEWADAGAVARVVRSVEEARGEIAVLERDSQLMRQVRGERLTSY